MRPHSLVVSLALASAFAVPTFAQTSPAQTGAPPSRALAMELCREPRLAGTRGSERAGEWVAAHLTKLGWSVAVETRSVLLSLPTRTEVQAPGLFHRRARFNPDAVPTGDIPLFLAWAKAGDVTGEVVFVGRGLRADFQARVDAGVDLTGKIALATYGGAYRGVKVALAAELGCAGALLFSPSSEDGPDRGPAWPQGPWKPAFDAQRGSILSLTEAPGDPSTPGFASPLVKGTPGDSEARGRAPLSGAELEARLPTIPALPLGSADAELLLAELSAGRQPVVKLALETRVERREIHNVIASLLPQSGAGGDFVLAGTHRDAWVRGAQDSGSGVVTLLRAAEHLAARYKTGWRPANEIRLAFWDGEETGLFGSTEWGEAHRGEVSKHLLAYVNGDACVGGLNFHASGTPGLLGVLRAALENVPSAAIEGNLWQEWSQNNPPRLGLPGSGSDYTVFLHHLGLPVLDLGFGGVASGQYHTAVDDFALMDQFIDPEWRGHETAGLLFAQLLTEVSSRGRVSFHSEEAARELSRVFAELPAYAPLAQAFRDVAQAAQRGALLVTPGAGFYQRLRIAGGLPGRPWYTNALWAPGVETGYAAELLPTLAFAEDSEAEIKRLADHVRSALIRTAEPTGL